MDGRLNIEEFLDEKEDEASIGSIPFQNASLSWKVGQLEWRMKSAPIFNSIQFRASSRRNKVRRSLSTNRVQFGVMDKFWVGIGLAYV